MASRPAARVLRQSARQIAAPAVQRRTFVSALQAARAGATAAPKAAVTTSFQQVRGKKTIDFAGHKETVYGAYIDWTWMRNAFLTSCRARGLAEGEASGKSDEANGIINHLKQDSI